MKHKMFVLILLMSLILSITGTAFAQEQLPPHSSGAASTLSKSEFGLPLKAGDSQQLNPLESNGFVTATTPLVNGDFEQGPRVGWWEYDQHSFPLVLPSDELPVPPHGGNWAAWLGGVVDSSSGIDQYNISIVGPTSLRLWYWIGSEDSLCSTSYSDWARVKITDTWGSLYSWELCAQNNTYGWVPLDLNLNEYDGQTIKLSIEVKTDEDELNSNLFIDDVILYKTLADVPYGYWSESFIYRLYNAGVTSGCATSPVMYCPVTVVTRDQMAVFLLKAKYGSSYAPPAATGVFQDVPTTHWAAAWIEQLALEGITSGCGGGSYCPTTAVTRDQMAVFLVKAFNLP